MADNLIILLAKSALYNTLRKTMSLPFLHVITILSCWEDSRGSLRHFGQKNAFDCRPVRAFAHEWNRALKQTSHKRISSWFKSTCKRPYSVNVTRQRSRALHMIVSFNLKLLAKRMSKQTLAQVSKSACITDYTKICGKSSVHATCEGLQRREAIRVSTLADVKTIRSRLGDRWITLFDVRYCNEQTDFITARHAHAPPPPPQLPQLITINVHKTYIYREPPYLTFLYQAEGRKGKGRDEGWKRLRTLKHWGAWRPFEASCFPGELRALHPPI